MNTQPETFSNPIELKNMESLAFFGKVNASISHELKNIMAIISETAGLLTDLSEMAKRGNPIELDMLTESTQSIVEEIQRGFTTIRQMNRFSHSVDNPLVSIDLREILDLVSHLSGYLAFAGRMNIRPVDAPPRSLPVRSFFRPSFTKLLFSFSNMPVPEQNWTCPSGPVAIPPGRSVLKGGKEKFRPIFPWKRSRTWRHPSG